METTYLREHHLFREGGLAYLFVPDTMRAYRVGEALAGALEGIGGAAALDAAATDPALRETLDRLGLLSERPWPAPEPGAAPRHPPVTSISLNVAQICNMSCIYCYGGDGEYGEKGLMSEQSALEAVDWLLLNAGDAREVSISFFGGEPLMNFPLIRRVVEYVTAEAEAVGKRAHFSITTNATLLDAEVTAFLNAHDFSVTISFDGDGAMQDANRPMKDGTGSYALARPRIERFLASRGGRALGRATVTRRNADLGKIRSALREVGFQQVAATVASVPVEPAGALPVLQPRAGACAEVEDRAPCGAWVSEEQHEALLRDLEEQARESLAAIRARTRGVDHRLADCLRRLHRRTPKRYFCGVGRSLAAVSVSGELYPCHRFVGQPETRLGTVRRWDAAARQPYLENVSGAQAECRACWARHFCGGGCIHDNLEANGDPWTPNRRWCRELMRTAELAIGVYDALDDADRRFLRL